MRLMERDKRILGLVREMGFITTEQVRHEFADVRESELYRRLGELEKAKLIRSERVLIQNRKLYLAVRENFDVGREDIFGDELPFISRPRLHQIDHDLKVTNVRIALQRFFPDGLWTPESILKRRAPKPSIFMDTVPIGDGQLELPGDKILMIEVECSQKAEKRIRAIMASWIQQGDVDFIVYVATTEVVFKRLYAVLGDLSELRRSSRVMLVRYEELVKAELGLYGVTTNGPMWIGTKTIPSKEVETHGNAN